MKARLFAALGLVALLVASVIAEEKKEEKVKLDGIKCPVSGKAATENSVDYKGGKVYFCCENCPKAFDAKKHGTKANAQLVATGQVKQAKCPLSGGKLNPETAITVGGAKVCFCCEMCQGKVKAAKGDEQLTMVFGDAAFEKAGFAAPKK